MASLLHNTLCTQRKLYNNCINPKTLLLKGGSGCLKQQKMTATKDFFELGSGDAVLKNWIIFGL